MEKRITFVENIDEKTVFEAVETGSLNRLILDFDLAHFINSLGIRELMKFLKTIPSSVELEFWNCRTSMVRTFNMVTGVITPNVIVKSFFVPFECESCDKEVEIRQSDGQEYIYNSKLPTLKETPKCPICSAVMEPSIVVKTYLKFFGT